MGPTWVLSAPGGPHVGPMNLAIRADILSPKCNTHPIAHPLGYKVHYIDAIMTTMASQITSLTVVYSTVCSDADQRKHQSSVSLAFVWGIHRDRWIPHTKGQLRGKCFHLMTSSWWDDFCQSEVWSCPRFTGGVLYAISKNHLTKNEIATLGLQAWINFNQAWISNYIHYKMWDEIIYPFSNFTSCTVEVWEWISNLISHFTGHVITYTCCGIQPTPTPH